MEIGKLILGASGLFALLIAIIQLILKAVENRNIKRAAKITQESADQREDRKSAEQWNAAYRSRAEAHLPYDSARRSQIYRLQDQVNDERERNGQPPIDWPELPEAPSLFPPPAA